MINVQFVSRCPDLQPPARASEHASGFDLRAAVEEDVALLPGKRILVPTGISVAIPAGYEGQVRPRSGLALRNGIGILNSPGTVDADYRGEIGVILINHGQELFMIQRGDRIAQLVIVAVPHSELLQVDQLPDTARGEGGFGSSGTL
ncbi:MAG: dUTP diphosphatase [Acidobacteriota bacterium]